MNFNFEFDGANVIEAIEFTKYCVDTFRFISDTKIYQINLQFSFIFSKKVEELIRSDITIAEYTFVNRKYKQEFLDLFFSSIIHNKIIIENQYIEDFIQICKELKVKGMNKSIESFILANLCNSIQSDIQLKSDDEMYSFLNLNIQKLNLDLLKGQPIEIVWKIITNSQHQNEDEYALLILNSNFIRDENLINFIQTIKFEELSMNVYEKLILKIQHNEDKSALIQNFINRGLRVISTLPTINLLNITDLNEAKSLGHSNSIPIDFSFLSELNSENNMYKINVTTIYFNNYENTPDDYLNQFNFLILGGCDGVCWLYKKYFSPKAAQKIIDFHKNKRGVVFLLHDINGIQGLSSLYSLLGYRRYDNNGCDKKVKFNEKSEKLDIITSPFVVGTSFDISETHQCSILDPKYTVLSLSNNDHYYSENLKENIAECSMSHTSVIPVTEKKFICNAICHLFNHYQASMKLIK